MRATKDFPIQRIWLIKPALICIIGLLSFNLSILSYQAPLITQVSNTSLSLLSIIGALILFSIPLLTTLSLEFNLENNALIISQGYFNKKHGNFFYHSIQDVKIMQGPIDRILGIYNLRIENASTRTVRDSWLDKYFIVGIKKNSISLPGLSKTNAESLKQELLQKAQTTPDSLNASADI
jgi:membrane protein YdbS with pleckstrin-like domain